MADRFWVGGGSSTNWNATGNTNWSASSGGVNNASVPGASDNAIFDANSGSGTVTIGSTSRSCINFDASASGNTFAGSSTLAVSGSFAIGSGTTWNYTGTINLTPTGPTTVAFGGKTHGGAVNFSGSGGSWTLQDAFSITGTLTLLTGAIDANTKAINAGTFSSSNSNTRSLNLTNSTMTLSGSGTIWNASTSTNMSVTITGATLVSSYSGSNSRTFNFGSVQAPDIKVTGGTGSVTLSPTTVTLSGLDFTGYTGTAAISRTIKGSVTLGAGMSVSFTSPANIVLAPSSGTTTFTSNGVLVDTDLEINAPGATVQLGDDLNMSGVNLARLSITAGTFDTQGHDIAVPILDSSNTNTRTITLGSSTITLPANGLVWSTSTNRTMTANTATLSFDNKLGSNVNLGTGSQNWNGTSVEVTSSGGGSVTFPSALTWDSFSLPSSPVSVIFSGAGQTAASWTLSGTVGNLNSITGDVTKTGGGTVSVSYCTITNSDAAPASTFFADDGTSVNGGGNTGWNFGAAHYTLTADPGAVIISGSAATIRASRLLSLAPGAVVIDGQDAAIVRGLIFSLGSGEVTIDDSFDTEFKRLMVPGVWPKDDAKDSSWSTEAPKDSSWSSESVKTGSWNPQTPKSSSWS